MTSLILVTATRLLAPALVLFALFMLLRGHDAPGGGFIGGLLVAAAIALVALVRGKDGVRKVMRIDPVLVILAGLLAAVAAALLGPLSGSAPLTVVWTQVKVPGFGKLGSALLFDTGVLLVVVGAFAAMISSLSRE
jgi:multicomponent Na+:H+ antiporter subunit B